MLFLRLKNLILNTTQISTIVVQPTRYLIQIQSSDLRGGIIFGSGSVHIDNSTILVCKEKTPEDYVTFTHWIDKNTTTL